MNQIHATTPGRSNPSPYRNTARAVGVLFLVGMAAYITGNVTILSILNTPDPLAAVAANTGLVALAATLMLVAAIFDAGHGILMLPVLRQHSERIAFGYLGYRIFDSVLLAVGVVFLVLQIPLGREYLAAAAPVASSLQALSTLSVQGHLYAYEIGMIAVGLAGLMLCYGLFRARLVPRVVAVWGLVGYAFLFGGSVLQVLGFNLALIHTIPGGLWEMFIGVWLLTKGFRAARVVSERTTSATTPTTISPVAERPAA